MHVRGDHILVKFDTVKKAKNSFCLCASLGGGASVIDGLSLCLVGFNICNNLKITIYSQINPTKQPYDTMCI